jgi:GDP-4-dehydro-6-deoxy-D-mannose reductase
MTKKEIKWDFLDILDPNSTDNIIGKYKPEHIFHLAANTWVSPSWDAPRSYFETNALGTVNLFESIRKYSPSTKILLSCTPEEYGDVLPDHLPINEDTKLHPINPYAASKVAQEMVALAWEASYNLNVVRTRVFNHEGPRRSNLGANASFAYQIAKIEAGLQSPTIKVGNLSARRNFTSIYDISVAYALAMEKGINGNIYLIGNEQTHTMKNTLEILISKSKVKNIQVLETSERIRPTELNNFVGDFSKFYNLTKWRPTKSIEIILEEVLNYWRQQIALGNYFINT